MNPARAVVGVCLAAMSAALASCTSLGFFIANAPVPFSSSNGLVFVESIGFGRFWWYWTLTPLLEFNCERLTYLGDRTGLSHVWVATGDLANCDLSADIGPPRVSRWRGIALDRREN